jgi:hypothetical protein
MKEDADEFERRRRESINIKHGCSLCVCVCVRSVFSYTHSSSLCVFETIKNESEE